MLIKDVKGMYEIKVDTTRCISYEKNTGFWTAEDFKRFHNDYVNKVVPSFKGKKWAKCADLTEYKVSTIVDEVNELNTYCEKNGFVAAALIVSSAVVKMQMNRAVKGNGVNPVAFTDLAEADAWLKGQGF
ncbi:hypothetical protein J2Z44_003369 [Clostridium punense]|uniref:STAS/SEC14 domain-containing protein n=1 Tax=Clostridium punense TaxID=1054297 RepID=A0ABS4K6W0_9CLOT|nr:MULTISPECIES: hypothetical protein [Clostridium]EQB88332.1 hypothetical protein M918_04700 [Clostridium sp. BL8]MBP2023532.1 hypothetical protein [Clostridium punense]